MASIQRLNIEQQFASVGIKVTPAQLNITTHIPKMKIQQQMPEMSIESQSAGLQVNWKQVNTEPAEHPTVDIAANTQNLFRKKTLNNSINVNPGASGAPVTPRGSSSAVPKSTMPATIGINELSGYNPFISGFTQSGYAITGGQSSAAVAADRQKNSESVQRKNNTAIDISPPPPELEFDPGHLRIKWSTRQFDLEFDSEYMPEIALEPPYSIEIFLRNRPSIRITVEEIDDPLSTGQAVDTTL